MLRAAGISKRFFACLLAAALAMFGAGCSEASGTAANPGFTGLWEYPTAEMPGDGGGRFGYTGVSPYAFYFADLAWLPWLEVNARLTTFDNVFVAPSGSINDSGVGRDYMDKAIDVKLMLHRSRDWRFPSLAVGVADVMGTELMKSWYGVATWRADRLALSLGCGTDRMNGFFAGVSWDAADWLTIKAEYSPMNYRSDRVGRFSPHPDAADSKFNVGAVLRGPHGIEGSISWQRGEEFAFTLSKNFDLNGPILAGRRGDYEAPGAARTAEWSDTDPERLGHDIEEALARYVKARDIEVAISEGKIFVAYENYGHASDAEAMVRALVVIASLSPHLESVVLVPRVSGVPAVSAEFPGEILFGIRSRDLGGSEVLETAEFSWAGRDFLGSAGREERWLYRGGRFARGRAGQELKAMVVYEPRIDQTLEDDYQSRWSVDAVYENRSARDGWAALADVMIPLHADTDIWWEPDMNDKIRLRRAAVSRVGNYGRASSAGLWTVGEAGWLDENWFGTNQWGRIYSPDGRWWGGFRLSVARDRDPLSFAGLADGRIGYGVWWYYDDDADPWQVTGWLQGGFSLPGMGLDFQLDYGRYIDEDMGAKFSAKRRWDDTSVGFWISKTERLSPGKDFTQAGISLEIPAEKWLGSWLGSPSSHMWTQDIPLLSAWRIDAGREPGMWRSPETILSQMRPAELKHNVENLLSEYCSFDEDWHGGSDIEGVTDFFLRR